MKPQWFDAFFILRPTLFFPAWTAFLAGYRLGNGGWIAPIPYLAWLALATGTAFLLNQLTDRREDQFNRKLLPLWGESFPVRRLYVELALLMAATVAGCIWAGWEKSLWLALFFIIAGVFYNFPPLRLKSRPILGIMACSIGGLILIIIGARAAGIALDRSILHGIPYLFAGAAASLLTHIPDMQGDTRSGARTFATAYGLRATAATGLGLVIITLFLAGLGTDYPLLFAGASSLPFFIQFYRRRTIASAEMAVKIAIFTLALGLGFAWPPFWAIIAAYYFFARWYHRERLGLDYPSFRPSARTKPEETPATLFLHSDPPVEVLRQS